MLRVNDGEFEFTLTDTGERKQADKRKPDPSQNVIDFKSGYAELKKNYDVKLLPDEKVDGRDVFVIEATPKEAGNNPIARLVFYFAKDLGLAVKMTGHNKEGAEVIRSAITEVKLNPEFAADRFTFKAPEGIEVRDLTKPAETQAAEKPDQPGKSEKGERAEKPEKAEKPDKPEQP